MHYGVSESKESFVLLTEGLRKSFSFGNEKIEVLHSVDLALKKSESLSIRGDSGCGKSTLLNLLARLELADSGSVYWEGRKLIASEKPSAREISKRASFLGVIYQSYYLIPELTVLENVLLPSRFLGGIDNTHRQRAMDLLKKMGVLDKQNQIPGKLSGGERQRVAIARALINSPEVILADEPTGNLDERTGGEVMDLLLQSCVEEETSLILVTHNPKFARATSRSSVLQDGTLNEV